MGQIALRPNKCFSFGICYFILFQNGCHFSILLFACKLALVASFKGNILLNFEFKNEAARVNLQVNKRTLKWRPFWNKVYCMFHQHKTIKIEYRFLALSRNLQF